MQSMGRNLAFVLASSNHGTMIVNRNDYRMIDERQGYGVGFQILQTGSFDPTEVRLVLDLLALRRKHHGDGVVAIDCGANIGVHTIEWAKAMTGWGSVLSIEAQERIYYALAGNIAINNCFNALAINAAVSSESGVMQIPSPNYLVPSSFGSLELRKRNGNEFIGQHIDYENMVNVRKLAIDEFNLPRVDLHQDRRRGHGDGSAAGRGVHHRAQPSGDADRENQGRCRRVAAVARAARLHRHRGRHQYAGDSRQRSDAVGDRADHPAGSAARGLRHDPEKACPALGAGCEAVFPRDKRGTRLRGDHAQINSLSEQFRRRRAVEHVAFRTT